MCLFTPKKAIQNVISPLFNPVSHSFSEDGIEHLRIDGLKFALEYTVYTQNTTEERIILCKHRNMLESYLHFFSIVPHARIVELGIFQGGSALFFGAVLKNLEKLVAFDKRPASPVVEAHIRKHSLDAKLSLHYEILQDSPEVASIVQKELGDSPDVIIDDCSHLYGPTKASFQMLFPLLRPGGLYIIEDWWWAHRPRFQGKDAFWHNEPALTNLIFDLAALQGTNPLWITSITLHGGMLIVHKGAGRMDNPLDMVAATMMRGKNIGYI